MTVDCLVEEQTAEREFAQAEELKAERDRWAAALEASERQITHLTDKAAALEGPRDRSPFGQASWLSPERGGHERAGCNDGDPGDSGGNPGHADTGSDLPGLHHAAD